MATKKAWAGVGVVTVAIGVVAYMVASTMIASDADIADVDLDLDLLAAEPRCEVVPAKQCPDVDLADGQVVGQRGSPEWIASHAAALARQCAVELPVEQRAGAEWMAAVGRADAAEQAAAGGGGWAVEVAAAQRAVADHLAAELTSAERAAAAQRGDVLSALLYPLEVCMSPQSTGASPSDLPPLDPAFERSKERQAASMYERLSYECYDFFEDLADVSPRGAAVIDQFLAFERDGVFSGPDWYTSDKLRLLPNGAGYMDIDYAAFLRFGYMERLVDSCYR